ncbi:MAG: MBL fold metallo-hydrolase [Rhabdochlamydiaceae bacterium]|jgi:phosphoribosyl 1,2-cyclic phosphodiesterase
MRGFCPLASGSKGNSIFLGTENTRILVDAGISAKATQEKLQLIGIDITDIDAILITHEHVDHIRGLASIAVKHKIPVFANSDTAHAILETLDEFPKFKIFSTGETFEFGDLEIHPFSIQHDTLDPVAFTIRTSDLKLGFCTDLGFATTLVKNHLKGCDYLYIEANHEPSMVHSSPRPMIYKQRVLSRQGHLSNQQCAELLSEVAHPGLKHIHLAHLSEECNHPQRALEVIQSTLDTLQIPSELSIAFQHQISKSIIF